MDRMEVTAYVPIYLQKNGEWLDACRPNAAVGAVTPPDEFGR